jgi:imidazolonepropionase
MTDLVVHSAAELVVGYADDDLETIENGALAVDDGEVVTVGPTEEVRREYPSENAERSVDASGRTVLPGFVDPHTHARPPPVLGSGGL